MAKSKGTLGTLLKSAAQLQESRMPFGISLAPATAQAIRQLIAASA